MTCAAHDAKGRTVRLQVGDEAPIWAKVTTVRESAGFVTLGFKHPAYGSTSVDLPRMRELDTMPDPPTAKRRAQIAVDETDGMF